MPQRFHLPVLIAFSAVLFTLNLGGYDLWPPDEPRFAQVAREMMQSGDYLVPHINGEVYLEKPPLMFWLTALFSAPFGDVTEVTARMPSAVAGVVTVVITYALATRLYSATVAFWSGLILVTFQRFLWQARFGQIDMLLTALMAAALLCLWLWHTDRKTRYLVGFYAAIAGGMLAKGPPALVFPLLAAVTFYWGRKADRRKLHLVWGTLATVVVALVWLVPARMAVPGDAGAHTQIGADLYRQIIGRLFLGVSKDQPFWYYFVNLPADLAPWTLLLPFALPWVWRRRGEGEATRFLLSWIVPAFIFFSLSSGKRAIYLLPLHPAIAILMARCALDLVQGDAARMRTAIGYAWAAILVGVAVAPFGLFFSEYADSWSWGFVAISVAGLGCAVQSAHDAYRNTGRLIVRNMVGHFGVLACLLSVVVLPVLDTHKSAKEFCAPLRALSESGVEYTLYSYGFSREEYVFYAKHFHEYKTGPAVQIDGIAPEQAAKLAALTVAAAEGVPVAAIEAITEAELAALEDAVFDCYDTLGLPPETARAHRAVTRKSVVELFAPLQGKAPFFVILRETEWRRVLAYAPELAQGILLKNQGVGRRHVLLVANAAGAEASRAAQARLAD